MTNDALTTAQQDYAAHDAWWDEIDGDKEFNLTTRNQSQAAYRRGRQDQRDEALAILQRLEIAIDLYLGRSPWTQTQSLKGLAYSARVRKELYEAHDKARAVLGKAPI